MCEYFNKTIINSIHYITVAIFMCKNILLNVLIDQADAFAITRTRPI